MAGAGYFRRLTGVGLVGLALGSIAMAMERRGDEGGAKARPVALASGAMRASNSREGQAILSAAGMAPGQSVSGEVTITNAGDGRGSVTLAQHLGAQAAGAGGGQLFDRLMLEVRQNGGSGGGLVYTGPISAMGQSPLGSFEKGASRSYEFTVSLPDGGAADDAYQGSSVSVDYAWTTSSSSKRRSCRYGRRGTPGPDLLTGTRRDDRIHGRAGDDLIRGLSGPDCLYGGHGGDELAGAKGADRMRGGYGDDVLRGGSGNDVLRGRQGDDVVIGGPGRDVLRGTSGDDLIRARDGEVDRIRCGIGTDAAIVDPLDVVLGCEHLRS